MPTTEKHRYLAITETIILCFIWLIIFAGPAIFNESTEALMIRNYLNSWIKLLPFFLLSLINHFILVPLFLFKKNKWWYLLMAIITALCFVFVSYAIDKPQKRDRPVGFHQQQPHRPLRPNERRNPPPHLQPRDKGPNALPPKANAFLIAILILGFDSGLRTAFRWSRLEKEREVLEKEKVKSELAFLRNQVSPHFFMNTLNNIHSLIDFDTEEAKGSIIRLSKLMRHLLYESETDRMPVDKEMDFIRHYVDLMKLRYSKKVDISLQIENNIPNVNIPPLLFTSYLENAFKHGVSYQSQSFIHIAVYCNNKHLIFSIKNSNPKTNKQDEASGIGTINSQKRLDLLYKDLYQLDVKDAADYYLVKLSIPL